MRRLRKKKGGPSKKAKGSTRPARSSSGGLAVLLAEKRLFKPSAEFRRQANVNDARILRRAAKQPENFWAAWAARLEWFRPWKKVLEWKMPNAKWFVGGKLNVSVNCLDRHIRAAGSGRPHPTAPGSGGGTRA